MNTFVRLAVIAAIFLSLAAAPVDQTALDSALALVPKDASAFVVVPNPKRASDDLQECIQRMDRPEAALAGRPIDQLKAYLKISAAFDDKGGAALAMLRRDHRDVWLAFLPVTDGDAFLKGNFTEAGDRAWKQADGTIVFARVLDKHVLLSFDSGAVESFVPDEGIAARVRERLGPRGSQLLARGDLVAWSSGESFRSAIKQASSEASGLANAQIAAARSAFGRFADDVADALFIADFDPLGVGIRTFARATPNSALDGLLKGGKNSASKFDRLPQEQFYFVARMDLDGLGGAAALDALLKAMPGAPAVPEWFAPVRDHAHSLQFAVYPSKLGIAAGGLLNDALLVVESDKPELVRNGMKQAILATAGEAQGMKREPSWVTDKELKGGAVADAFELKETPVEGSPQAGAAASASFITHLVFGSRGFVGFVKQVSGAVVMTFSQRIDVLERAVSASGGGKTLANDGTIKSFHSWLIEGADVEGFIGVAQLGKLMQQLVAMVPVGDAINLPQVPANVDPIAFAVEVDGGSVETASVFPTSVLTVFYDSIKRQLGTPATQPKPATP